MFTIHRALARTIDHDKTTLQWGNRECNDLSRFVLYGFQRVLLFLLSCRSPVPKCRRFSLVDDSNIEVPDVISVYTDHHHEWVKSRARFIAKQMHEEPLLDVAQ